MSLHIIKPGLQTTVQGPPRVGYRHLGVPASGAADRLSLALANRLVGNALLAPALEVSLVGPQLRFERPAEFALTGASAEATLNDEPLEFHRTQSASAGDVLWIGNIVSGSRAYIACAGGVQGDTVFGSSSTYLPARLGGFSGRPLLSGDLVKLATPATVADVRETPRAFRPPIGRRWMLRTCRWHGTASLSSSEQERLFTERWTVGRRADRMGLELEGATLNVTSGGRLPSAAVFPGTIQCPEHGTPFLLSVDAQTTGGYARVAQVARVDRHLLGQLRPGDSVSFLPRTIDEAVAELRAKHDAWREWLPDIETVI